MIEVVKRIVPRSVRWPVRKVVDFTYGKATRSWTARSWAYDLHDAWDWFLGQSDPLVPPRKLVFGIGGDLHVGERFLGWFKDLAALTPEESVLDVGCGVGRAALPLTRYLSARGRYDGFDIMRPNIAWCKKAITPRFPNFQFQYVDLWNREYNPRGKLSAGSFRFPYPDATFDFAFLTSVFTHLMPGDAAHYIAELGRVLKPGGRCLATFFLLNDESTAFVAEGKSKFTLEPLEGVHRIFSRTVPETAVAFLESFVEKCATEAGLTLERPIRYGLWSGRETWFDYQDVVILRKPVEQ